MIPLQKMVNDNIREGYKDRSHDHWHVSSLGNDLCAQYLERTGAKPDKEFDDRIIRVFKVGNIFEEWLLNELEPKVDKIERQMELVDNKLDVSGHPDAIVTYGDTTKVYELKTIHSRGFWHMKREGRQGYDHHRMQLWMYLYMTQIEEGNLVYMSKDDLCINEYPVFLADGELKKMCFDTLDTLNEAWKLKIPPKPVEDRNDFRYKYNNYREQCDEILKSGEYYEQTN